MPAHHSQRLARTLCPSTRYRSCSSPSKMLYGLPYVLVRWIGLDTAGDTCSSTTANWHRRRATTESADRLQGRGGAARRPGRCAGGQDCALLVARRRLAARHRRPPLPARRLLACGGLQPADVGAARQGGHAPRRRLLRLPMGASLAGPGGGCGPGPSTPGLPTLSLSLVGGSSQLPAGRSTDIRIECSAFYTCCVYFWLEQR